MGGMVVGMQRTYLLSLMILGCASRDNPKLNERLSAIGPGSKGCFDPADYGAIPNDGIDDRLPMQTALDAASVSGGTLCLGSGRWNVSRAPIGSYNRFAALATHGHDVVIRGTGPDAVIELAGDQGGGTLYVVAIDQGARNIRVTDLTIDTAGALNTEEQTHAIIVGTGVCQGEACNQPVQDVTVERVNFIHPHPVGFRKGDCLRLVGSTASTSVRRVTVIGNAFTSCARSGISIQRNVFDLKVIGNQFTNASDQDIDAEPTGIGENDGLEIIGNTFNDDRTTSQGDFSLTVVGITPYAHVIISGNNFKGRGMGTSRVRDIIISGNVFDSVNTGGYGVINADNTTSRLIIANNVIRRSGFVGPVIRMVHHSGGFANGIRVSGNTILNATPSDGIHMESATNVSIVDNDMTWTVPAPSGYGIYHRAIASGLDSLLVANNRVNAPLGLHAALELAASPLPIDNVSIVGNMFLLGSGFSVRCDQTAANNFRQPIVLAANNMTTAVSPNCAIMVPFVTQRP